MQLIRGTVKDNFLYAFLFLFLAVVLRALSFHYSIIDHDETTYMVIAQELLEGKLFYIDVWDTKPVGIFLLFALVIKLAGNSILAVRLSAALFIGFTAFLIYLASKRWGNDVKSSVFAGIAYIVMCSMHLWNFSANSEIFFNFFTALALFLFLGRKTPLHLFLSGLAIGVGFIIKYFVLFDLIAFWIFFAILYFGEKEAQGISRFIRSSVSMFLGGVVPFLLVFFYFTSQGLYEEFAFATFTLPGNYASLFSLVKAMNFFLEFQLVYAPLVILAFLIIIKGKDRLLRIFGLLWMALVWIVILVPGKFFHHYYFQLLVPMSFILGGFGKSGLKIAATIKKNALKIIIPVALIFLSWNVYFQYHRFIKPTDTSRVIASYLESHIKTDEALYCNTHMAVYFLLDKSPMHKYVHTTLTTNPEHIKALGINTDMVMLNVVGQQPDWLLIEGNPHRFISDYINEKCTLEKEFDNGISLFRRHL